MMTDRICEALLANTEELIILFAASGSIIYGNASVLKKLECNEESLKKHNMSDLFLQEFQQSGKTAPFDVEKLKEKEETVMYREKTSCFAVRLHIIDIDAGEYLLFAEDITWEKDLNLRIRQVKEDKKAALKMKDEFTANVTHELRTPVNGIRGHVMGVIDDVTDADLKKTLDLVLYCCDNISSIINNILDFSKLEANKFILEEREFDFYSMIEQTAAIHMAEVNKKEIGLNVTISDGVPRYVVGDSLRIGQILNNLLSNAVKFTKVGGITVDVTETNRSNDVIELFFMVRDTGIGISKEEQDKLFKSFMQVDASVTRNYGGTGLGLFITKQLVEMMGGTIHLDSEKGRGSCFSFNIKLHLGQADNREDEANASINNSWKSLINTDVVEEDLYVFGSHENKKEITKRMEKLVLSMELGSWEKAEMLTDTIKTLAGEMDSTLKRVFLRLEMAIRKENYDAAIESYGKLKTALDDKFREKSV